MTTLADIEAAAEALPPSQKQELLLFLASRLRQQRAPLPPPRDFSPEQLSAWINEDEAAMRQLKQGK